jgi:2'-5' RNA ligase
VPGRVFVALELPEPARDLLDHTLAAFLAAAPSWNNEKPVDAGLFHVTLAFIGAMPDPALPALIERLDDAARAVGPFMLELDSVRAVPSRRRATMVWASLAGEVEDASRLAGAIERAAGLPESGRPFRPHVTLARARRPRRVHDGAITAAEATLSAAGRETDRIVSVRSVTVFSSTLGKSGPAYEPLAVLALGEGAEAPGTD